MIDSKLIPPKMSKLAKPVPLHKRRLIGNGSSQAPSWVRDAVPISALQFSNRSRPLSSAITYKLLCAAGVLVQGSASDLLLCILAAREAKAVWSNRLPDSSFRIHIFYPNRQRVPAADIAAALRALDNADVRAAVALRRAAGASNSPARSAARTAVFEAPAGRGLAVAVDVDFCQAGVVAPPDSPDLGISVCGTAGASGAFA